MMTPNADFFNRIEDYCLEQLNDNEMLEFEAELSLNPKLNNEMELWMDICHAIQEKEVLNLRDELSKVANQHKPNFTNSQSFEMLNEVSDIQEISEILTPKELFDYFDSLPKAHVHHQNNAAPENIHHFYKEQNGNGVDENNEDFEDFDLSEFVGLEEAILEKDILQFRQTLKQVAKSVESNYSIQKIDEYLSNEMMDLDMLGFESMMHKSKSLQEEVRLQSEIDSAIGEIDVIDLRKQLLNVLKSETSWNVSEQNIEDFIDGMLEVELMDEFNSEFSDNLDLQAEVTMRKQVNEAIGEKDIFDLRAKLKSVNEESKTKKVNMIIPESKPEKIRFWRNSVAIIVLLIGLGGVLSTGLITNDRMYEKYYNTPSWSPERSVSSEISVLQQANMAYSNGEYKNVIEVLNQLPESELNKPVYLFYKAASLQNMLDYNKSIELYTKVIKHGDNLFIEESEWYRSLCYVKIGNKVSANHELNAVIDRKGHFEKDAKAILKRLRFGLH